jgi:hypothetical protein
MPIRDIIKRTRHDGCGGRAGKVELLTGTEDASSRPDISGYMDAKTAFAAAPAVASGCRRTSC